MGVVGVGEGRALPHSRARESWHSSANVMPRGTCHRSGTFIKDASASTAQQAERSYPIPHELPKAQRHPVTCLRPHKGDQGEHQHKGRDKVIHLRLSAG